LRLIADFSSAARTWLEHAWSACYAHRMRPIFLAFALALVACATQTAPEPTPATVASVSTAGIAPTWDAARSDAILARTQRLYLAPDMSALSDGERAAVRELLAAGQRMELLYEQQRHPQALAAAAYLQAHPELTRERDLFRMNSGPIATTLDNTREAFLSVAPEAPARNVYPAGTTRETMDAFFAAHPDRRDELLDDRSVVWAATPQNRSLALTVLNRHPVLDTLHPGLRARLTNETDYLSVPYSVAYAEDIFFIVDRLNAAAADVESGDAAFARYLRLRARDLLSDD